MSTADIYLASPRGFCAGVKRAVAIVEKTLHQYGAPVFVRHEIVHNKYVVENLKQKGAVFIEELSEINDNSRPVIISAHGAPQKVFKEAEQLNLKAIDATCPLVKRVHQQIKRLDKKGCEIIVIGKKEHAEIIGTTGQIANQDKIHIINSLNEAENLQLPQQAKTGVVTQTTLAAEDTDEIIALLQCKFPSLETLSNNDICYATTHRQAAVKELAKECEAIIVIGSKNSSNSKHLKEIALRFGAAKAFLIDDATELDWKEIINLQQIGISAGASAPEYLVEELINEFKRRYDIINIHNVIVAEEQVNFKL